MAGIWLSTIRCLKYVNILPMGRCKVSTQLFPFYARQVSNLVPPEHVAEPSIPPYMERQNEDYEVKRARLLYQSRKRGMTENGLLLSTFAAKYLDGFNETELKIYDKLINQPSNDWDIYYWVTEATPTPAEFDSDVMMLLKKHARNVNQDVRSTQPDLY